MVASTQRSSIARRGRDTVRFALAALAMAAASPPAARADSYRLGAQDALKIQVFDWRANTGDVHPWTAISGEFVVGAGGTLSIPVLGEVKAQDRTTAEVAREIATRLQSALGLARQLSASVEVKKYRPFYVVGTVDKPGEYAYRPGLKVLEAFATAGGVQRSNDQSLLGYERDSVVNRGEVRSLTVQRLELLVRQSRLDAELANAAAVSLSEEVKAHATEPDVARAIREEGSLLATHNDALRSQVQTLNDTKKLLQNEVSALSAKQKSLARQLDLARAELQQVNGLASKGLVLTSRRLALEQNAAQFETLQLDVMLASLRALQDVAKADRDIVEITNKRRSEALVSAAEVRARLADIAQRIATAEQLIYYAEVRAPQSIAMDAEKLQRAPIFKITRRADGQSQTLTVQESDPVEPGDTLRVLMPTPDRAPADAQAAVGERAP